MHRLQENPHPRSLKRKHFILWSVAALLVIIIDSLNKAWAIRHFSVNETSGSGVFALTLHKNPGIVFDVPVPLALVIPLTLVIIVVVTRLLVRLAPTRDPRAIALWCLLLGASGNLLDRTINGFTTDYLLLFQRSAINLADVLIGLGILLFFFYNRSNSPQA